MAPNRTFGFSKTNLYQSEIVSRRWQIKHSATFGNPISIQGLQMQIDSYQNQINKLNGF